MNFQITWKGHGMPWRDTKNTMPLGKL